MYKLTRLSLLFVLSMFTGVILLSPISKKSTDFIRVRETTVDLPVVYLEDYGSGFVVSSLLQGDSFRTVVLTARHVLVLFDDEIETVMLGDQGKRYFSTDRSLHPDVDAGVVVFITDEQYKARDLSDRVPLYGEKLKLEGFPEGKGPFIRQGLSSGDDTASFDAWPGDSGGPVSDEYGRVVGILVATEIGGRYQRITFMSYVVLVSDISDWLGKELSHDRLETPREQVRGIPVGSGDLGE